MPNVGKGVQNGHPHMLLMGMNISENSFFAVSSKDKHKFPIQPSNYSTLVIYPREMQTDSHTKACAKMFIAALFITAPKWRQSRCQSIPQWDAIQQQKGRKHWCKCNMGDSPKDIMPSERSQTQRTDCTLYDSIYRKHPEEANLHGDWFPQLGRELRSAVNRH